jgi:subtilisin family serine protease
MLSYAVSPLSRLCAGLGLAVAMMAVPAAANAAQNARFVVSFKPGSAAAAAARAAVLKAGGRIKLELIGGDAMAVELPKAALAALRRNTNIALIEEDAIRRPLATTSPSGPPYARGQLVPYGIKMVQADQLPDGDAHAGNRKLCIIDSGYDNAHEDLNGNPVDGEFDSGTGNWDTDENHHGTHVAGTVAAINQRGVGVVGVNPNKKLNLHIVKVFGADGWAYSSTLANAARKCKQAGANVISMSLGGGTPNAVEMLTFNMLSQSGMLSIAAAGNDGNARTSYPAGYASVMSVAALDETKTKAVFSQFNADVEIAGPGVSVLSSVPMGTGSESALTVGAVTYAPGSMDGSPIITATGPLADFGLGETVQPGMTGKVCLISRGNIAFADKVLNCQSSGGIGAVVYNNAPGGFLGTLGTTVTAIPSVTASDTEGAAMLGQLGQSATVAVTPSNYAFFDGTSMATPHVSAVAALVWSYFPSCTGEQIRSTLNKTAEDLGTSGRDTEYGFGLVRAKAAYDRLASMGCVN